MSLKLTICTLVLWFTLINAQRETYCPPPELIAPCRCSQRDDDIQVWCSHSDLPRVLQGIKSIAKTITRPIDELILENNQLPSLPGRFFAPLKVLRLMLRHNGLERVSNGWLNDLHNSLVEIFIVERDLRNIPVDSLFGLKKLEAVTIESENLKRIPIFSGLPKLKYVKIKSNALIEISPQVFRDVPSLETIQIIGSLKLNRLEAGVFDDLPNLHTLNMADNGIGWIHLRALSQLPRLKDIILSGNKISDAGMIGRAIKDLEALETLKLDNNHITILAEGSFVDLPSIRELKINDNAITEIHHGAFHRTPKLKIINLENNFLNRVHPESFLLNSGSVVEYFLLQNNEIERIEEVRSLLNALPMLKFLDLSNNRLESIPFGALRGHGSLEQLYLDSNKIRRIERDAFMAMPALRELRLRKNNLSESMSLPFWNLPGLKGLDLSSNNFKRIDPPLLMGLPSLRRLDMSDNHLLTLNPATFDSTPFLEAINVSRNQLNMIHPFTFRNLNRLFEIDASYNHLQEVIPGLPRIVERVSLNQNKITNLPMPPNKSLDLPNLRMLELSGNMLQRIQRSAFKSLAQLRYLGLAKNRLQTIDENSLIGLDRLEKLTFQDNRLIALHENSLSKLGDLRELNIQGNRLELFVDNLLSSVTQLKRLDLSRNNIVEMSPNVFRSTRSLQALDISNNYLETIPESLSGLTQLKEFDISFNNLNVLSANMLSTLTHLEELRASNNKVTVLPPGTFSNLPYLQYLDLSSNKLSRMERGSIQNLPQLQEIVLADNELVEIGDRVCDELPSLQAVHLQQNKLNYMSPYSFYRSPSIVYLNISSNQFKNLEHVGLRSVRNLEVLDLSGNAIRRISTNPLRGLDWLVELKLDDNQICKVNGEPFSNMPRLRVLTMRNNRMKTVTEPSFRSLRGNLVILDLDGNPIDCSCQVMWLQSWYQETDSLTNYPGPRCRDGSMLRESRMTLNECQTDGSRSNKIPLTNEHGDIFQRKLDYDDCDIQENFSDLPNNLPPLPGESEYFYDQYIDYQINETNLPLNSNDTSAPLIAANTPNNPNFSNTILNFNKHKQQQLLQQQQQQQYPGSQFTFFGMPLSSLNMGNLWNLGRAASTRSATGTKGKPRVQIYRPGDTEILKFYNPNNSTKQQQQQPPDDAAVHHQQSQSFSSDSNQQSSNSLKYSPYLMETPPAADILNENQFVRPTFQTSFLGPSKVEKGGFNPMLPGSSSGFSPIHDPYSNSLSMNNSSQEQQQSNVKKNPLQEIQLITESSVRKQTAPASFYNFENIYVTTTTATAAAPTDSYSSSIATTTEKPHFTNVNTIKYKETNDITTNAPEDIHIDFTSPSTMSTGPQITITDKLPTVDTTKHPNYNADWENINQSPSSLSALVAPGAQLGVLRSPPGRSTITKIYSTVIPTAEEYHRTTTSTAPNNFNNEYEFSESGMQSQVLSTATTTTTTAITTSSTNAPNAHMDWYFANYNRTFEDNYEAELNRHKNSVRRNGGMRLDRAVNPFIISLIIAVINLY